MRNTLQTTPVKEEHWQTSDSCQFSHEVFPVGSHSCKINIQSMAMEGAPDIIPKRPRIRVEIDRSIATCGGAHKILITLPNASLTVAEFLCWFQLRHLESEDWHLVSEVGGFALPPNELVPLVLQNDDVVFVRPASLLPPTKKARIADKFAPSLQVPHFHTQQDSGRLFAALSICGAVFVPHGEGGLHLPAPNFTAWRDLWQEVTSDFHAFRARLPVRSHQLRFSQGEDLFRTLVGESKAHTPDVRYNFGVGQTALRANCKSWKDLKWIPDSFKRIFLGLSGLVGAELSQLTNLEREPGGTLGANVLAQCESWAGSRLRHSLYPGKGSCTEHTDYGILTLQQSNGPGLEAFVDGKWQQLEPPPGFVVLFAGDMLEILTNGFVKALRHRVCVQAGDEKCARQSNIVFLQPDNDTLVQPLAPYMRGDPHDIVAVRYGDWHKKKTSLAFSRT